MNGLRVLPVVGFASGLCVTQCVIAEDRAEPLPAELAGVGIEPRLETPVPLGLEFTDQDGRSVRLGGYFTGDRPVVLTLGYYECPMLCDLVLNGLIEGLQGVEWVPGAEFDVVSVSIDPSDSPQLARLKKQNAVKALGKPTAASGWHFLTGDEASIKTLADAVGFGYKYLPESGQFAHGAGIFFCTPQGKLARFLGGVKFESATVRMALVETSQGRIGTVIDQVALYCYHYDADAGRYAPVAMVFMRIGGVITLVAIGIGLGVVWKRERERRRSAAAGARL